MTEYSIKETINLTGCTRGLLERLAFDEKIEIHNGMILSEYVDTLIQEKETYISLLEYSKTHSSGNFNGNKSQDRDKLHDIIEQHDYFDLEVHHPDELLSGASRDGIFFLRNDICGLNQKLKEFFST